MNKQSKSSANQQISVNIVFLGRGVEGVGAGGGQLGIQFGTHA